MTSMLKGDTLTEENLLMIYNKNPKLLEKELGFEVKIINGRVLLKDEKIREIIYTSLMLAGHLHVYWGTYAKLKLELHFIINLGNNYEKNNRHTIIFFTISACAANGFDYNSTVKKAVLNDVVVKFAADTYIEDILKNDITNGYYDTLVFLDTEEFYQGKKYCDISCQKKVAYEEAVFLNVVLLAEVNKADFNTKPFYNWKTAILTNKQWDEKY